MKKLLLSLSAFVACMSMSAAVPTLTAQYSGSFNATQESPSYSNPSAYDADGNLYISGAFNDTFDSHEAVGTSAYLVKYDKTNTKSWSVALTGAATINSVTTDASGDIYIAGTFADEVEFGSTDGHTQTKTGLVMNGEPTTKKNASFLAKYNPAGELFAVRTFVPEALTDLKDKEYYPADGDIYFCVTDIQAVGDKIYVGARFTGETTIDGVKFGGTYQNLWDFLFFDIQNLTVFSLDRTTLNTCQTEATVSVDGPVESDEAPNISSLAFTVVDGKVYAGFITTGVGKVNVVNGELSEAVTSESTDVKYVLSGNGKLTSLVKASGEGLKTCDNIAGMVASGNTLYVIGTSDNFVPATTLDVATEKVIGFNDIFVATLDASTLAVSSITANAHDEGTSKVKEDDTEAKANFEEAAGFALVDGALYINTVVYNYNEVFLSLASYWFDDNAYTSAPVAATGVASGNRVLALVSSDATKVDYDTYTFTQTGITNIEADFDENAPVEYYNLQGIRVNNPENGLYIRRQGNKVEKVIL